MEVSSTPHLRTKRSLEKLPSKRNQLLLCKLMIILFHSTKDGRILLKTFLHPSCRLNHKT
jgi:hypothetical protein